MGFKRRCFFVGASLIKAGKRRLRKGFTTGTCAAAGAKAAAQALFAALKTGPFPGPGSSVVPVTLPSGKAVNIEAGKIKVSGKSASATVVKDAGDDPDVTNGAEIVAWVELLRENKRRVMVDIRGGPGIGVVTRPGLKVPVGGPAINPVPREMIKTAVKEAARGAGIIPSVRVTVSAPEGVRLAKKTMNPRLGIMGGISILGTTGIVEPLSLSAYTHSISCAVTVAIAGGCREVVLSTGRSTEKVVEKRLRLPPHAFILTGDHMGFALRDAGRRRGLERITVAGQFGKFSKLAAGHFETHFTKSDIELAFIARVSEKIGVAKKIADKVRGANTAREAFFLLKDMGEERVFKALCSMVRNNASRLVKGDKELRCILVGYDNEIVSSC